MAVWLRQLARCYGIEPFYQDGTDSPHTVPASTLQSLLSCMGVHVSDLSDVKKALKEAKLDRWRRIVEDVLVVHPSKTQQAFSVVLPIGEHSLEQVQLEWVFENERFKKRTFRCGGDKGKVVGTKSIDGVRHVRMSLHYPRAMVLGYYRLTIKVHLGSGVIAGKAFVIVSPRQCYRSSRPRRSWGLTVQLYGLRSQRNWGMGDLNDLQTVVKWAGETLQAGTVGVSPIHAPTPGVISPYSPSSRLFLNPLYLNIERIPEFQNAPALQKRVGSKAFQAELGRLRQSSLIDYEKVTAMKWPIFEALFKKFQQHHGTSKTQRARAFGRYIQKEGMFLERFSVFQALTEYFGTSAWEGWPEEFQNPHSVQVERFRIGHKNRIRFFQYLQWQCEEQLQGIKRTARRFQMPLGLNLDLPVGIHPYGADAWMFHQELAVGFSIGAPPDWFNRHGQNWGLVAPLPTKMRANHYQFFIETIRHNMRHGGVLRIDHALGLFRLFVIPEGGSGKDGAYLRFPVDELLAMVALESVRNRVVVVGEDLGTVTPIIKKRLAKAGILSYRVLLFEKKAKGAFRSPGQYPENALVSATTHDLPTLHGFWLGRDIEVKTQIGFYPSSKDAESEWKQRARDRVALMKALNKETLLPLQGSQHLPVPFSKEFCQAVYAYLARTPSRILIIPLEDLLGEVETPNFPGIPGSAYPSWRRKIHRDIEGLTRDGHVPQFSKVINRERLAHSRSR
ncbi:MAG: 4-alpha-glucanotransferase [Nitrospirota bacterium]|nr:MAG: 4-alpha-glucanotransferase [Nitrospirota bacterium]